MGLVGGILKYRGIMNSPNHRAHPYIDIAHRAALLYSVAAVVMAALLTFSPYSDGVQLVITGELAGVGAIVWGFIYTQFLG